VPTSPVKSIELSSYEISHGCLCLGFQSQEWLWVEESLVWEKRLRGFLASHCPAQQLTTSVGVTCLGTKSWRTSKSGFFSICPLSVSTGEGSVGSCDWPGTISCSSSGGSLRVASTSTGSEWADSNSGHDEVTGSASVVGSRGTHLSVDTSTGWDKNLYFFFALDLSKEEVTTAFLRRLV
jgi:hypothetical protein